MEKTTLHPRNKHRSGYDFQTLCQVVPELSKFVSLNKFQNESIDFSNPEAVKMLNKALLKHFYKIDYWDIPPGYLCPPVPGRADYIHYLSDLLAKENRKEKIKVLDIGTGANLIYPIIGVAEYGWEFVGTDIDAEAIRSAEKIIKENELLKGKVELRLQKSPELIFKNVLKPEDRFDITICNPPFHASAAEANLGTQRKWKNLGIKKEEKGNLNFGGQKSELWCEGGERAFIYKMILESVGFSIQCKWFSTLVSKSVNLPAVYGALEKVKAKKVETIEMELGNKISRIVAWSF
jgi:23S rRNA (adenine1618-N6)-methyltransferase